MSEIITFSPKLWFDPIVSISHGGDCDCSGGACPSLLYSESNRSKLQTFAQQVNTGVIQHLALNQETFFMRLDDYLVVLYARSERIVVLDPEASRLLAYLPCSLQNLRMQFPTWPVEMHTQIIALFLALQVLTPPIKQMTLRCEKR